MQARARLHFEIPVGDRGSLVLARLRERLEAPDAFVEHTVREVCGGA
jgi:hypothetical protein